MIILTIALLEWHSILKCRTFPCFWSFDLNGLSFYCESSWLHFRPAAVGCLRFTSGLSSWFLRSWGRLCVFLNLRSHRAEIWATCVFNRIVHVNCLKVLNPIPLCETIHQPNMRQELILLPFLTLCVFVTEASEDEEYSKCLRHVFCRRFVEIFDFSTTERRLCKVWKTEAAKTKTISTFGPYILLPA